MPPLAPSSTVNTVCGYCGVGCGLTLDVKDGVVAKSKGTASHPANQGRLCTKGSTTADMLNAPGRLTTALVRPARDAAPVPVDVDDAIAQTAARLSAILAEHGPDAIGVYVSGQMSLEAQYLANKLTKGFLRTNQIESNSRLCMASAGTGYKQSLGADGPPGSYDDLDHADVLFAIGANVADCHPILYLRMMDRVKAGAKLIVVDPRRTATAAKADLYLPVKPGTDLALLNGLLRLIVDGGGVDEEFIAEHTDGWEQMAPLLADYPADRVAELTGVPEADLRTAAQWLIDADDWVSLWTMGLNQSTHGTWHTNALCNLHLATGAICRTGSGPFSLTGQPNAMGGREMGYMGPGLPGQRTALIPAHREYFEHAWGLEPGAISADPGGGTIDMFERMAEGQIKAAWIICTNPVASVANRSIVTAALQRAELVVVQDVFDGTETAEFADVILPATLWTESEGVLINSERNLTLTAPAVAPPGQARPDWKILCDVATAMGFGDAFDYPDASAVFDEIRQFHNPLTGWDLRGIDYERLREGPVQWPAAPGSSSRNPIRYLNDGVSTAPHVADDGTTPRLAFPTDTRRAKFLARPYLPPAELPDDDFPMLLTTGRLPHQWHTMTKTGRVAKLNKLNPSSFVEIHPDDADRLEVADGDTVEVRSRRGLVRVPARVTDGIVSGTCFVPMHWGDAFGRDLAVNAVTNDAVDPDSLQPEFKACAVQLTRVAAENSEEPPMNAPVQTTPIALSGVVPVEALAAALGTTVATPALTGSELGYVTGLVQGLAANPPVGAVPTVPPRAPLREGTRAWVDGVLAGLYSRTPVGADSGAADTAAFEAVGPRTAAPGQRVTVVWASQTGTVEEAAQECADALTAAGLQVTLHCADQIGVDSLHGVMLFLVATTGDGEAPDNGATMWDALVAATAEDVADLRFSVLGFGDSSYADFCGFARKLDSRLALLGARRISDRASCEPDYEETAEAWRTQVLAAIQAGDEPAEAPSPTTPSGAPATGSAAPAPAAYSRKNPLTAELVDNVLLTAPDSGKEVRRFAFALPAGTLTYAAGDALGVWPRNRPALVEEWLARTGLDGDEEVEIAGRTVPLVEALTHHYEIARVTHDLVNFVNAQHDDPALTAVADDSAAFADWSWGRQSVDLLTTHPVKATAAQWCSVLRPMQPRLYSISSSPRRSPDRVEVTVSAVRFEVDGAHRHGVCSTFLADAELGQRARIFIAPNKNFGPPEDPQAPMIMIGPGTGVAPFRGFLHDRAAAGASGDNWLFFGERHEATDFYYRDELLGFRDEDVLTRLDAAFSRDQPEKVYVQDLMRANAADLWSWISRGAHLYVCGDAARMARDVDDALREIVAEQGRLAPSSADAYISALAAENRYVRDVY
ncbi:MAG: bifunctional nitrate reductase/sulfite reductase flavoprotein subunit alpha [Gordonia sp. (in: high G+C Gram-positive bacteria)]